jgi:hypothetical protein
MIAHPKILLPRIRNLDPNVIASQLIGVQNMSGPVGNIFTLTPTYNYSKVKLSKVHYRHFLRIYNRRTFHDVSYITTCGYPTIKVSRRHDKASIAAAWCEKHLKSGSFIYHSGQFWFAYDRDFTIFLIKWAQ